MIKANGTDIKVEGSFDDVVAEYLYLTDAMSEAAANQLNMTKSEWLDNVFDVVSKGILEKEAKEN